MTYIDYLERIRDNLIYQLMPSRAVLDAIEREFVEIFPGDYEIKIDIPNEHTVEIHIKFEDVLKQIEWKLRYG